MNGSPERVPSASGPRPIALPRLMTSPTARCPANELEQRPPASLGARAACLWRRLCQSASSRLSSLLGAYTVSGGRRCDRHLAGLGRPDTAGWLARPSVSLSHPSAGGRDTDDRYRTGICGSHDVLAPPRYRYRRHTQPVEWRRERLSSAGACGALACSRRSATHGNFRALQSRWRADRRTRCVVRRITRNRGSGGASKYRNWLSADVSALWCARRDLRTDLPKAAGHYCGRRRSARGTVASIQAHRVHARGTVQPRCLRRWFHRSIAAGFVAAREISPVGRRGRDDLLLDRCVFGFFVSAGSAYRGSNRSRQHDGVHPSSIERLVVAGSVRACARVGDCSLAGAERSVPDGCTDTQLVCDGRCLPRRAGGGGKHYFCSTKLGLLREPTHRRLLARHIQFRLAADHRGRGQDCLRSVAPGKFPIRPPTGGATDSRLSTTHEGRVCILTMGPSRG